MRPLSAASKTDPVPRFKSPLSFKIAGVEVPGLIVPEFAVMAPTVPVPPRVAPELTVTGLPACVVLT